MPGTHAAMHIKICHFVARLAIEFFLRMDMRTTMAMMRMLKSTAWAFDWLKKPLTRQAVSGSASGLGVWPLPRNMPPEMVFPRP